jgi:hypothetical protein
LRGATGHFAAATAIRFYGGRLRLLHATERLGTDKGKATNDGQHRFHDFSLTPIGESRRTFFGFRLSVLGSLSLGIVDDLHVFAKA